MTRARVLIAALLMSSTAITPASAADGYRYWSYWQSENGAWNYAKLGPAMMKATDGAVDGWRFGVGTVDRSTAPALRGDFDAICAGVTAQQDQVRVAVVIDFGPTADAPSPRSACAVVAKGLTRASALAAVAPLRLDQGFVCGIDGYPATGCGESVTEPVATPTRSSSASARATSSPTASATASTSSDPVADAEPTALAVTPVMTPTSEPSTPAAPLPQQESSALPTIVTMLLATTALVIAMRNARRQQEARRK